MNSDYFPYQTEPIRGAVIATAALLIVALFLPFLLFQLVVISLAAGPGSWALTQALRRGRGVRLTADSLMVQNGLAGRVRCIPYERLVGYTIRQKRLIVGWQLEPPPEPPVKPVDQLALTDLRPETHRYPRRRLVETTALVEPDACLAALAERTLSISTPETFPRDELLAWANRRRARDTILLILTVLATPVYVIIIGHILGLFLVTRSN